MKQTRPPAEKTPPKSAKPVAHSAQPKNQSGKPNRGKNPPAPTPPNPGSGLQLTWQMKVLAGLGLAVMVGLVVILALQPTQKPDKAELQQAVSTALGNTGFTPPPTFEPGSEFGVSLVIFSIKDYIPALPDEKVTFSIINRRQKSLYVSNCDGIVLQRFLGSDSKDKKQAQNFDNWESIAPGGFRFCGPLSGREARRIEPGVSADASFTFSTKVTRPYNGKSWDTPGTYRLLVQYSLTCPNASTKIADCLDPGLAESEYFKIVAPVFDTPAASLGPALPAPTSTAAPKP